MSLYFLVNNFIFAFSMVGAIVFLMAAWLSFDSYKLKPDGFIMMRSIGFVSVAISLGIRSLMLGSDVLSYFGLILFIIGTASIIISFFKKSELVVHAVIVIPAFTIWSKYFNTASAILLFSIAYLSFRQWKREYNPTWVPFGIGFVLMGISAILGVFYSDASQSNIFYLIRLLIEVLGFTILGYWVWQYMRLRIRESVVMISVGVTFLLATVVTLTFSTILISRVTSETSRNLITDVKVLDFSIAGLEQEALAKTALVSGEQDIIDAVAKNDTGALDQLSEKFLQQYNLGFLTITDKDGNVIVRAHALSRRGDTVVSERAFEEAVQGNTFVTIEDSVVEGLSIRAGAPIKKANVVVGAIIAGYPLDNAFVDNMKRVTGLEMFIYKDDTSVAGTAFALDGVTRLVGVKLDDTDIKNNVFDKSNTVTGNVQMFGELFKASYAPLANKDGKVVGMLSAAKHEQDIINIANATNRLTLVTVIIILLVLLFPIYILSKRLGEESI